MVSDHVGWGIGVLGGRIDRLFIAHFVGMNETGVYAAQANLLMGFWGSFLW